MSPEDLAHDAARVTLLGALYEMGNGDPGRYFEYVRVAEATGLDFDSLVAATRLLIEEGLVDSTFADKFIGLTRAGVLSWVKLLGPENVAQSGARVLGRRIDAVHGVAMTRLTSILFLDVHGWSRLDELGIVQYVGRALPRISSFLEERNAAHVNTWGDAIVATFAAATEAAAAALEIQGFFEAGDMDLPAGLRCRISLHAGDVVVQHNPITKREDIFGDAVHMAARLEPVTTPGYVFCTQRFAENLSPEGPKAWPLSELVALPKGYGEVRAWVVTARKAVDPRPGLSLVKRL